MAKNEALGTYEAACLMGVHWTRPRRMADAGLISAHKIASNGGVEFAVYSSRECEENFQDYQEEAKNKSGAGRPRTALHLRADAIKALGGKDRPRIKFDDAIGVAEAAKILGVFWTRVIRIVEEGHIVGRVLWSKRGGDSRLWVLSRKSCIEWAKEIRRLEAAGAKRGRPRKESVAK